MQLRRDVRFALDDRPFSILNRIGGDATGGPGAGSGPADPPFSILNRIGGDATTTAQYKRNNRISSFSILNRIGGDATSPRTTAYPDAVIVFQYPQSDRRRCNWPRSRRVRWPGRWLSVSSIGSEAMQLNLDRVVKTRVTNFQYPQSDRRRCNLGLARSTIANILLSVSSIGSEAMQPWFGIDEAAYLQAFSILNRIGGDATKRPSDWENMDTFTFSILNRIGGDATEVGVGYVRGVGGLSVSSIGSEAMQRRVAVAGDVLLSCFQYPQSDRRRCNRNPPRRRVNSILPFSILNRIGGDATNTSKSKGGVRHSFFQYPQSDRRRCNRLRGLLRRWPRYPFSILNRIGGDATILSCWE